MSLLSLSFDNLWNRQNSSAPRNHPVATSPAKSAILVTSCDLTIPYRPPTAPRSPIVSVKKTFPFPEKITYGPKLSPSIGLFDRDRARFDHSASKSAQNSRAFPFIRRLNGDCWLLGISHSRCAVSAVSVYATYTRPLWERGPEGERCSAGEWDRNQSADDRQ